MGTEEYVKFIFSRLVCSNCEHQFTPECIEILRVEGNTAIVKIECVHCHKNYGIAVVGVEITSAEDSEDEEVLIPGLPPITSDDVIDAHQFIENLGSDWAKYIPEEFKDDSNS